MYVKSSLVGSSDISRKNSAEAIRQMAHKDFVENHSESYTAVSISEPNDNDLVKVMCIGRWVTCAYKIVKSAGFTNWIRR